MKNLLETIQNNLIASIILFIFMIIILDMILDTIKHFRK